MVQASIGVNYYSINILLVYLCTEVGFTVIYTILVTSRLLVMRHQMKQAVAKYDSSTYDTVVLMVVESAMLYTVFASIFIVAFALHSDSITTICFLSIGQIQVSMQKIELSASLMLFQKQSGHCPIVHHHLRSTRPGSYARAVDPSYYSTYEPSIRRDRI